jgi:hypothetical protein
MELVEFSVEGEAPVSARLAFDRVVPRDDSTLFRGYLRVLPAVVGVSHQTGPWNHPGEQRTVHLSDGSEFREELVQYAPPETPDATGLFDYRVSGYTKILGRLVSDAYASWRYEPRPGGSVIRWTYGFRPLPRRRFVVQRLIGPIWRRYMLRSMAECVRVAAGA